MKLRTMDTNEERKDALERLAVLGVPHIHTNIQQTPSPSSSQISRAALGESISSYLLPGLEKPGGF